MSLLQTPVGHEVLAGGGELLLLCAVGEHRRDLGFASNGAFEYDVAIVGRPGGEVVAAGLMGELHPAARGDVHEVDVLAAGSAGTIFAIPGEGEELAVGSPRGRDGIAAICETGDARS